MESNRLTIVSMLALGYLLATAHIRREPGTAIPSRLCITHVTVIDIKNGSKAKNQTVVIVGDRISAVLDDARSPSLTAAKVVDGTNKYLIPGLWDMHVHATDQDQTLPLYIANGVTGVREMFGPPNAAVFRTELEKKQLPMPHIYLGSPIIDGHPKFWPTSIEVNSAQEARSVVDDQKQKGAEFIKIYPYLTREEFFAIADESRKDGIPFVGHTPHAVTATEASSAGMKSIEHFTGIAIACSAKQDELARQIKATRTVKETNAIEVEGWRSEDKAKCAKLYATFIKNGTWPVATFTVFRGDAIPNPAEAPEASPAQYFHGSLKDDWFAPKGVQHADWTLRDFANARDILKLMQSAEGEMFRAGVPPLAGTDTGNTLCFPGFSLHDELALLVESGVTPLGALQAATLNPAKFMQIEDRFGTVAEDKVADLVLLDADPLENIRNTSRIAAVFLGGREFDRADLDKILTNAKAGRYVTDAK